MAKESTLKNMLLTLSIVTLAASTFLGMVYAVTKGPIEEAMIQKTNSAIMQVVPEFTNDPSSDKLLVDLSGKSYWVYPAKNGDNLVGLAVESSSSGFGGRISLMVGFSSDGTIYDISVLSHTETPGLGDKIESSKSNFSVQFKGTNPDEFKILVKKDGGDVDAITASTITSRAYCDAVRIAYEVFKQYLNDNK